MPYLGMKLGHWPKVPKLAHTLPILPPSPKFHSVLLYGWPFPRYWQFCIFPLATMLNFNIFFLILIWNFKIPISNFCEESYREHSEKVWCKKNNNCRRCSVLKVPLPLGPMLMKISIFFKNLLNLKFQNVKK